MRLSAKHGLNPTMPVCFWCGKETGEVALLGASYSGEAPMRMVLSYEPCAACQEAYSKGVRVIEASTAPNQKGQPAMQEGIYPTGAVVVLTEDGVRSLFAATMAEQALKVRAVFMDTVPFRKLFGERMDEVASDTGA